MYLSLPNWHSMHSISCIFHYQTGILCIPYHVSFTTKLAFYAFHIMYLSLPNWLSMHSISCFFHFLYVMIFFLPVLIVFTAVYNTSISTFDCVQIRLCMFIFLIAYMHVDFFSFLTYGLSIFSVLLVQYHSCPTKLFIYAKLYIFSLLCFDCFVCIFLIYPIHFSFLSFLCFVCFCFILFYLCDWTTLILYLLSFLSGIHFYIFCVLSFYHVHYLNPTLFTEKKTLMHVYIYIHKHTCIQTLQKHCIVHMHTYIHIYKCTHIYACIYIHKCPYKLSHTHTHTHTHGHP